MNTEWEKVRLGELVKASPQTEAPQPGSPYRQVGVKWWGEGVYERETIDGANTAYKEFTKLCTNNLIYNKIWAKNGSIGVVTEDLNGCYASSEFPVYIINYDLLNPKYMHYLTKMEVFWANCAAKSYGTSGKSRLKPSDFLQIEIPLPPLREQEQIVQLAERVEVIRKLQLEALNEVELLIPSIFHEFFTKMR